MACANALQAGGAQCAINLPSAQGTPSAVVTVSVTLVVVIAPWAMQAWTAAACSCVLVRSVMLRARVTVLVKSQLANAVKGTAATTALNSTRVTRIAMIVVCVEGGRTLGVFVMRGTQANAVI